MSTRTELDSPPAPEHPPPKSSKMQFFLRNLFSIPTLLTVLVLLALEGFVRFIDYPPPLEKLVLEADPFLLWDMPEGERREQGVTVHVNSHGMRAKEFVTPKPRNLHRVLAIGDSSVYGFGVEDDQVFTQVLEKHFDGKVEVLNAGVGGYSTVQSLRFLYKKLDIIQPDLLIIGNLWSDNNFDSFVDKELLEAYAGKREPLTRGVYRYMSYSRLFRSIDYLVRPAQRPETANKLTWMPGHGKPDGRRRVELNDYASNLDRMSKMMVSRGGEVLFLTLANRQDVEGGGGPFAAWDPYRQAMRDTAARYGSDVLEVAPLFKASGLSGDALFWDQMHPTAEGHKRIGDALAKMLKGRGWPEKSFLMAGNGADIPAYQDPFLVVGFVKATAADIQSAVGLGAGEAALLPLGAPSTADPATGEPWATKILPPGGVTIPRQPPPRASPPPPAQTPRPAPPPPPPSPQVPPQPPPKAAPAVVPQTVPVTPALPPIQAADLPAEKRPTLRRGLPQSGGAPPPQ